jgi:hypothetical protein
MFVNWGIEAFKWQMLLQPFEKKTFTQSLISVFAGCSISMLTPNRTGEFGGRILFVKSEHIIKAISTTVLGSLSQLLITLFVGIFGVIYIKSSILFSTKEIITSWLVTDIVIIMSFIVTFLLFLIYFKVGYLSNFLNRIKFAKRFLKQISIVSEFSNKELLRIIFLSFLRYLVFILQYILILKLMKVELGIENSFWLLSVFYFTMAVIPTIGILELPVRGMASVYIFGLISTNILGIQVAALAIWIINIVIPAVIGSFFILFQKRNRL